MMRNQHPRNARQAYAGLQNALGTVAGGNPVVAAWRWRYELGLLGALVAVWAALGLLDDVLLVANVVGLLGALAAIFPVVRRYLAARAWCVITPHRVRVGCVQAWIHSRYGKIPVILLTTRQPFGERVYLWCRAGTMASDFVEARELLAAACWADDVWVWRGERHAQLVCLDVIRHQPWPGPDGPVHDDWTPVDGPSAAPPPNGDPSTDALALAA